MKKKTITLFILSLIVEAAIIGTFAFSEKAQKEQLAEENTVLEAKYAKTTKEAEINLKEAHEQFDEVQKALDEAEKQLKEAELKQTETELKLAEKSVAFEKAVAELKTEQVKNAALNKELTTLKK